MNNEQSRARICNCGKNNTYCIVHPQQLKLGTIKYNSKIRIRIIIYQ